MLGIVQKIKKGLQKTQDNVTGKIKGLFAGAGQIDEDFLEELEEILIKADVGMQITENLVQKIRQKMANDDDLASLYPFLKQEMAGYLPQEVDNATEKLDQVILVVGVNGSGKTTSIAKIAQKYKDAGKSVLVAAGDTFRAAAIDQISVWADRVGVDIVKNAEGSDPASVVYDALDQAKAKGSQILIIDTAGRLHTKKNLMDELSKIRRILDKKIEQRHLEILLILDATTGNNGLLQAKSFAKDIGVSSLMLTKLDSSAKGGFVFSIAEELSLPVKYIGVGEKSGDLVNFSKQEFIDALFD